MLTIVSHTTVFDDKVLTASSTACHQFNSAYRAYEYMLTAVNISYDKWLECDLAFDCDLQTHVFKTSKLGI